MFDTRIRNTRLSEALTTCILKTREWDTALLANFIFYVLPTFPNIRRIVTSDRRIVCPPKPGTHEEAIQRELVKLAETKLDSWKATFDNNGESVSPTLFARPSRLRSLDLTFLGNAPDVPFLDVEKADLARWLAQCSSLKTLKMTFRLGAIGRVPSSTLELPFECSTSLRSLGIDIPMPEEYRGFIGTVDPSYFRFAAKFSFLRHLRIPAWIDAFEEEEEIFAGGPLEFPALEHLELTFVEDLSNATNHLVHVTAPHLKRLDLYGAVPINPYGNRRLSLPRPSQAYDEVVGIVEKFVDALERRTPSTVLCHIRHPIGLYDFPIEEFTTSTTRTIRHEWQVGGAAQDERGESMSSSHGFGGSRPPTTFPSKSSKTIATEIEGIADWLKSEATQLCRIGDTSSLNELRRELHGVEDLKKFKAD